MRFCCAIKGDMQAMMAPIVRMYFSLFMWFITSLMNCGGLVEMTGFRGEEVLYKFGREPNRRDHALRRKLRLQPLPLQKRSGCPRTVGDRFTAKYSSVALYLIVNIFTRRGENCT